MGRLYNGTLERLDTYAYRLICRAMVANCAGQDDKGGIVIVM